MELVPSGSQGGGCYPLQVVETVSGEKDRQGCSLSEGTSETMVSVLEVFLAEAEGAPCAGSYRLRARRTADDRELSCEPGTIHLDLPLDPAAWSSRDLAESLRIDGLIADADSEVLRDEFGSEISGKDLIQRGPSTAWGRLKDGLRRAHSNWVRPDGGRALWLTSCRDSECVNELAQLLLSLEATVRAHT